MIDRAIQMLKAQVRLGVRVRVRARERARVRVRVCAPSRYSRPRWA